MPPRVMEGTSQVLYKGDSTTIAHQCTTNMNPNPLVFGTRRCDMSYRSAFPFAPSGYEFALDILV